MDIHPIRLRGPWECETIAGDARRVHMPATRADVLKSIDAGRLLCRRQFGCPTCLAPHEQVWLVIERPALAGEVRLNDEPLGTTRSADRISEFNITGRLRDRNELCLDFQIEDLNSQAGGRDSATDLLFADVRLEIRG